MKLRTLCLTVALLVAACLAVYFLQRPPASEVRDARVNRPVLDAALAARADGLRLADQGKTVTLKKQPDGTWCVADYFDLPADIAKLRRFVSDLTTDVKVLRLVTSRPERLARLEFKETAITLLDSDGKEYWRAVLGKYADDGGRFLRYGDEPKAYQVTLNAGLNAEPKGWVDPTLLKLNADDIAGLEMGFGTGAPFKASRAGKDDAWIPTDAPADKQLKLDRINSLVSSLVGLRFTDTSDPAAPEVAAAQAHSRTIKLTTFDGKSYTFTLGRAPDEKKLQKPQMEASASADSAREGENPHEVEATIPAVPVYARVTCSDAGAPINVFMQKRAFQVVESAFAGLPADRDEFWEDKPAPIAKPGHP